MHIPVLHASVYNTCIKQIDNNNIDEETIQIQSKVCCTIENKTKKIFKGTVSEKQTSGTDQYMPWHPKKVFFCDAVTLMSMAKTF